MQTEATALAPQPTHETPGGQTTIDDNVVAKIVAAAAQEVPGIHDMGTSGVSGAFGGAIGAVAGAVGGASNQQSTKGVSVEVGEIEALINLNIIVEYGARIPQVAEGLRKNISTRVEILTGLRVKAVNIHVSDVFFPTQQAPALTVQ